MKKKITITLLSVLMTIVCAVAVFSIYEGLANSRGPIAALKSYFTTEAEVNPPQDPTPGPVEDEPVVHEHEFGEWVLTTPATCTEEGLETSTCSCGETQTRTVAALGHDFSGFLHCVRCGVGMVFTVDEEPNKAFYFDPDSIALIEFDTFEADDGVVELISENPTVYYFDTSNDGEITYIDIDGDHNADYYWENNQLFKAEFDGFKLMTHLEVYRFHNEHTYSEEYIAKEATLTEEGYWSATCVHCGASQITATISPELLDRVFVAFEDDEGTAVYGFIANNAGGTQMYCGYVEIIDDHILWLVNAIDDDDYFQPCSSLGDHIFVNGNEDDYLFIDDTGNLRFSEDESIVFPVLTGFDTIVTERPPYAFVGKVFDLSESGKYDHVYFKDNSTVVFCNAHSVRGGYALIIVVDENYREATYEVYDDFYIDGVDGEDFVFAYNPETETLTADNNGDIDYDWIYYGKLDYEY